MNGNDAESSSFGWHITFVHHYIWHSAFLAACPDAALRRSQSRVRAERNCRFRKMEGKWSLVRGRRPAPDDRRLLNDEGLASPRLIVLTSWNERGRGGKTDSAEHRDHTRGRRLFTIPHSTPIQCSLVRPNKIVTNIKHGYTLSV